MKPDEPVSIKQAAGLSPALLKSCPRGAAGLAVVTGTMVLAGWLLDIPMLKSVLPGWVTMKANTALAFLLAGVSLWLAESAPGALARRVALVCALGAAMIGLVTLGEYASGCNFGLDQLLFQEPAGAVGTFSPGRMAPTTALNFLLLGLALVILHTRHGGAVMLLLTLAAILISLLAFLGYLYRIQSFYGLASLTRMAVHTSVVFMALGLGIMAAPTQSGLMTVAMSDTGGGTLARRLLPAAVLIPALLGWLRLEGERHGWYGTEFGLALFTLSIMVALGTLVWWNADLLYRSDTRRRRADEALKAAHDELEKKIEDRTRALAQMVVELREGIRVLTGTTGEILNASTQLAANATQIASAVTETTATAQEVRHIAELSSRKAASVQDTAQKAAQVFQVGSRSAAAGAEGMRHIHDQMESIAGSMDRLNQQTQTIGQIIATVDDLAVQSNLLAVNAAIEAARAGEHGKGFGVVADEVMSLADQSKQATAQVRAILRDVQKATAEAVLATGQGSKAVDLGVLQSLQAGESIQTLANSVTEASQAATQIAASSHQQLIGMDQVVAAVTSVKQASLHNVESARLLETSTRDLNQLGQKLKELVENCKL